jgi:hypothetical protein
MKEKVKRRDEAMSDLQKRIERLNEEMKKLNFKVEKKY